MRNRRTLDTSNGWLAPGTFSLLSMLAVGACAYDSDYCGPNDCGAKVAQGQSCLHDYQCEEGLYCLAANDTCAQLGTEGAPCQSHADCDEGLDCYAEYHYANVYVCLPPGLYGYPCPAGKPDCAAGYDCSGSFAPTCHKEHPEDSNASQSCTWNSDCPAGLVCNWGYSPHVCTPMQAVGGTCGHDNECLEPNFCDEVAGFCTGPAGKDEWCSPGLFSDYPCANGLTCWEIDGGGGVCTEFGHEGDLCELLVPCNDGLECGVAPFQKICTPAGEGSPCGLLINAWACPDGMLEATASTCRKEDDKDIEIIELVPCQPGLTCSTLSDPPICVAE
ncbi:MAG: hypothetical protein FJ109_16795 [Deltaproteobacteria bacterium]|nr:hypothetical protein [Deltaproteobacteria bacterium]